MFNLNRLFKPDNASLVLNKEALSKEYTEFAKDLQNCGYKFKNSDFPVK